MTPKEISQLEQAVQEMKEQFCPTVRVIYEGFIRSGFSEPQAIDLAKTRMICTIQKSRGS